MSFIKEIDALVANSNKTNSLVIIHPEQLRLLANIARHALSIVRPTSIEQTTESLVLLRDAIFDAENAHSLANRTIEPI